MLSDQETIKKTRLFGLNTYEAKIWAALLSRNTSTAGELSDIANVPRSRSYDVLESLRKKGFVSVKLGKPLQYKAIPPRDVLDNIKKKIEENTKTHMMEIRSPQFKDLIDTFQELHEKNTSLAGNIVAVLKGRRNINKHLDYLFKNAEKEILFSLENKTDKHPKIIDQTKNRTRPTVKRADAGAGVFVVDEDNTIIFPISEQEVHPDYDLCVWIKNKHTTKFLRQLLLSA